VGSENPRLGKLVLFQKLVSGADIKLKKGHHPMRAIGEQRALFKRVMGAINYSISQGL
jgi:hypothetical protein